MADQPKVPHASSDKTRAALIAAGLELFGEKGFEATSTRDIAAAADANLASIAYHFGGKEGLRLACARTIADKFREIAGSIIFSADPGDDSSKALEIIETALAAMIRFITVKEEAHSIAAFMMREMAHPGAAVDLIYTDMMHPVHNALCRLWGTATDSDPESSATRLTVFAILGQVLYFRLAQPIVLKRMDWSEVGRGEADEIIAVVTRNLRTMAAAARKESDV